MVTRYEPKIQYLVRAHSFQIERHSLFGQILSDARFEMSDPWQTWYTRGGCSRVGKHRFSSQQSQNISCRSAIHCTALPCTHTQCTTARLLTLLNDGRMQREARSIFSEYAARSDITPIRKLQWRFVAIRGCLVRGGTSDANRHERCRTAIGT